MTEHTLHSFAKWLQAEIAELDGPDALDICEGAASVVREARRIAQSLGYPDLVPRCTTDLLRLSTAREILSRALAVIDPPASGPLTVKVSVHGSSGFSGPSRHELPCPSILILSELMRFVKAPPKNFQDISKRVFWDCYHVPTG